MKTLDKKRDFGIVYGDPERAFHQDGVYFNHEGLEHGTPKPKAQTKPAPAAAATDGGTSADPDLDDDADGAAGGSPPDFDNMTRDELKDYLRAKGVEFKGNASNTVLLDLAAKAK